MLNIPINFLLIILYIFIAIDVAYLSCISEDNIGKDLS